MNIDELTIGQAKELAGMFGKGESSHSMFSKYLGRYVIVRTRNEGVNAGVLVKAYSYGCLIKDARRLYKPISKDRSLSWYEGVSVSGLGDKSMVSGVVECKIIVEDYSLTPCTPVSEESIRGFASNETTY